MKAVGIDIGGMSIKVGLTENGKILDQIRFKTLLDKDIDIQNIINNVQALLDRNTLKAQDLIGIGVGCPGSVNTKKGIVEILPNLNWENVNLKEILQTNFNVDVKITNDANVAVLAEARYGIAKDYSTSIMFTLGTGVGGGIIIDKKLFEGGKGLGVELGHVTLVLDGEPCTCGRKGCVEAYVSATALIKQTKIAMQSNPDSLMWQSVNGDISLVSGKTAFDMAKANDKTAIEVVEKYVSYLSESIMSMLNIFRPEAFIIGGGISGEGEYLTSKIIKYLEKFEYGYKKSPKTEILTAKLGNDAGIIGASALFE